VKADAVKLHARAADPNTERFYKIKTKMLPFQHTVIFHFYNPYSTGDSKLPFKIHEYNIVN
jgi:hypothetical protein